MTDAGRVAIPPLCLALALLSACVTTRDEGNIAPGNGDQYLRYGIEAFAAGQPAVAESRFGRALRIFEQTGNTDGRIRAHINLAELAYQTRDLERAAGHIQRAADLVATGGNMRYRRRIILIQSSIALGEGAYDEARIKLTGLVGSASGHGNSQEPLDTIYIAALVNRAVVSREQNDGEFGQWVQRLKHSMNAAQSSSVAFKGRLLRFEAELHRRGGNYENADACFEQALLYYRAGSNDMALGAALEEWAQHDIEQEQWSEASHKLRRAVLLRDRVGDRQGVIHGLQRLVEVESQRGRTDETDAINELLRILQRPESSYGARVVDVVGNPPDSD